MNVVKKKLFVSWVIIKIIYIFWNLNGAYDIINKTKILK